MKKLIVTIIGILLFSNCVMADNELVGRYTTGEHNILITETSNGQYKYKAWNVPKDIGNGYPDWTMNNGYEIAEYALGCDNEYCSVVLHSLVFVKGNTTFLVSPVIYNDGIPVAWHEAYPGERRPPNGSIADLTIFINGNQRQHYWLYER